MKVAQSGSQVVGPNSVRAKDVNSNIVVLGEQRIELADSYQESQLADLEPRNCLPMVLVQVGAGAGLVTGGLTGLHYGALIGDAVGLRSLGGAVGSLVGGALGAAVGLKSSWFVADRIF